MDFCARKCNTTACYIGLCDSAYGQCLRDECHNANYCTGVEFVVLYNEIFNNLNIALANTVVTLPHYYGSKKKTVNEIINYVDNTVSFWSRSILLQAQEVLDSQLFNCPDRSGSCSSIYGIYSVLHSLSVDSFQEFIRSSVLSTIMEKEDFVYANYIDFCKEVSCVSFQEKSVGLVIWTAISNALAYWACITGLIIVLYYPCYFYLTRCKKK